MVVWFLPSVKYPLASMIRPMLIEMKKHEDSPELLRRMPESDYRLTCGTCPNHSMQIIDMLNRQYRQMRNVHLLLVQHVYSVRVRDMFSMSEGGMYGLLLRSGESETFA